MITLFISVFELNLQNVSKFPFMVSYSLFHLQRFITDIDDCGKLYLINNEVR